MHGTPLKLAAGSRTISAMQRRISAREVKRQVQTQTEGLIIKSRDINENDTVVKILTGDLGLISAFANGTKKVKSRTASAAVSPMTYSRLTLYCGRESYIVDDAKAIDVFSGCARTLKNYRLQIILRACGRVFAREHRGSRILESDAEFTASAVRRQAKRGFLKARRRASYARARGLYARPRRMPILRK